MTKLTLRYQGKYRSASMLHILGANIHNIQTLAYFQCCVWIDLKLISEMIFRKMGVFGCYFKFGQTEKHFQLTEFESQNNGNDFLFLFSLQMTSGLGERERERERATSPSTDITGWRSSADHDRDRDRRFNLHAMRRSSRDRDHKHVDRDRDCAKRWSQLKLRTKCRLLRSRLRSHLRLSGFDDFFLGFVCVLRNKWYYIFVW